MNQALQRIEGCAFSALQATSQNPRLVTTLLPMAAIAEEGEEELWTRVQWIKQRRYCTYKIATPQQCKPPLKSCRHTQKPEVLSLLCSASSPEEEDEEEESQEQYYQSLDGNKKSAGIER